MTNDLRTRVAARQVTRVTHFTSARNLAHILRDDGGIRGTKSLKEDDRRLFNPTDLARLDGYTDHVCCSIEYPNAWYFRKVRKDEVLFPDWVVLLLDVELLHQPNVLFSPRNAAAERGAWLKPGPDAFEALYAPRVLGSGGRTYTRGASHLPPVPTDQQAEVLIPAPISHSAIRAVAVRDLEHAATETARLEQLSVRVPPLVVAPTFFDADALDVAIRTGVRPPETPYHDPK